MVAMARLRTIHVAAAQLPGLPLQEAARSIELIDEAIAQASERKIDLLVLPECAYPAYHIGGLEPYRAFRTMDSETFVSHLSRQAARHRVAVVCGFVEDGDNCLYNAAVVLDKKGTERGRARKCFLWGEDNAWFTPGDHIAPIDTPSGRIGVVVCADGRAPEIAAGLVAQGAELIVVPTCWVNASSEPGGFANAQAEFMIQARAMETGVPIVAANKFGRENEKISYCGWSMICDGEGKCLTKAPPDQAAFIEANLSLRKPPKITIPDWTQRRLFGSFEPVAPGSCGDLETIRIAVLPANLTARMSAGENGKDLFEEIADQHVQVVGTWVDNEDPAQRIEIYGRALGMTVIDHSFVERLMIERFGAFGCIESGHVRSFAPARAMALDGASIIFVVGQQVPLSLLRTRAAENRVYLAAAFEDSAVMIDPGGQDLASCDKDNCQPLVVDIDLAITTDKYVYPGTHIWQQRKPECYARAFGFHLATAQT